jgi:hypothetical protein
LSNDLLKYSAKSFPEGGWAGNQVRSAGKPGAIHFASRELYGLDFPAQECYLSASAFLQIMATNCHIAGCKNDVPPALGDSKLCVLHFTLSLEAGCADMRRETALGNTPPERQREIMTFITEHGERLARVATSGLHLTDDLKARILSTFLTLMNLRENLDRASMRTPPGRSSNFR